MKAASGVSLPYTSRRFTMRGRPRAMPQPVVQPLTLAAAQGRCRSAWISARQDHRMLGFVDKIYSETLLLVPEMPADKRPEAWRGPAILLEIIAYQAGWQGSVINAECVGGPLSR